MKDVRSSISLDERARARPDDRARAVHRALRVAIIRVERAVARDDGAVLDDGRYDAFVVWAEHEHTDDDASGASARAGRASDARVVKVELTITTGAHKGDVVEVDTRGFVRGDPSDVIGLPCTLVVDGGRPRLEL